MATQENRFCDLIRNIESDQKIVQKYHELSACGRDEVWHRSDSRLLDCYLQRNAQWILIDFRPTKVSKFGILRYDQIHNKNKIAGIAIYRLLNRLSEHSAKTEFTAIVINLKRTNYTHSKEILFSRSFFFFLFQLLKCSFLLSHLL